MNLKLLIAALVLIIGFSSCTSSHYVTTSGSPNRHQGYKKYDRDGYHDRYGYYPRGHRRGDFYRSPRYRRW